MLAKIPALTPLRSGGRAGLVRTQKVVVVVADRGRVVARGGGRGLVAVVVLLLVLLEAPGAELVAVEERGPRHVEGRARLVVEVDPNAPLPEFLAVGGGHERDLAREPQPADAVAVVALHVELDPSVQERVVVGRQRGAARGGRRVNPSAGLILPGIHAGRTIPSF